MKFEHFKGLTLNLEVHATIKPSLYLLFISHNCTAAKFSSFHAGFKTGIHLKKHRFINIAHSHCSTIINRKKIKTLEINYIAFYITLFVVFIFFV